MPFAPLSCLVYVHHDSLHVRHCVNEVRLSGTFGCLSAEAWILRTYAVRCIVLLIASLVHEAAKIALPLRRWVMTHIRIALSFFTLMYGKVTCSGAGWPACTGAGAPFHRPVCLTSLVNSSSPTVDNEEMDIKPLSIISWQVGALKPILPRAVLKPYMLIDE